MTTPALIGSATVFVVQDLPRSLEQLAASQTKRLPGQGSHMRDFDMTDLDGNHLSFGMESTGGG
jgi:hypothetical protein